MAASLRGRSPLAAAALILVAVPSAAPQRAGGRHGIARDTAGAGSVLAPFAVTVRLAQPPLDITNVSTGTTASFRNTAPSRASALFAENLSEWAAASLTNSGSGSALYGRNSSANATAALENRGEGAALWAASSGAAAVAQFEHRDGGTALRTVGDAEIRGSLAVSGSSTVRGTKSAIVATSRGVRALYTEESTEVWFTDYGETELRGGSGWVAIDSLFAETVDLARGYHVFVQPYGAAALYVDRRERSRFRVRAAAGAPSVRFAYRVVARRRGFTERRLAPAVP